MSCCKWLKSCVSNLAFLYNSKLHKSIATISVDYFIITVILITIYFILSITIDFTVQYQSKLYFLTFLTFPCITKSLFAWICLTKCRIYQFVSCKRSIILCTRLDVDTLHCTGTAIVTIVFVKIRRMIWHEMLKNMFNIRSDVKHQRVKYLKYRKWKLRMSFN